ncbi:MULTISPECIES: hypothetical protein [unclassified Mesorhizobium]|uniref:hypothetical protein n=1 Tax=unclassified Mesorhizobium TaxID=325217 RepID=UPI00333AC9CA
MKLYKSILVALQQPKGSRWRHVSNVIDTDEATFTIAPFLVLVALAVAIVSYGYLSRLGAEYDFTNEIQSGESKYRQFEKFAFLTEPSGASLGNAITLYYKNSPLFTAKLGADRTGVNLRWQYHFSLWERIEQSDSPEKRAGKRSVISSAGSYLWVPYVDNITLEIPEGTLPPALESIMRYAENVSGNQFDDGEERAAIAIMEEYFLKDSGLRNAYVRVLNDAFWSGDIQFLTLLAFLVFFLFTLVTLLSNRLVMPANYLMESLPYLGFFGTLVGMAQALKILGTANLSDGLAKAISLGPIGSQMGLAIETTKFALVFYLLAGLTNHVIDVVAKRFRKTAGVTI